MVNQTLFHNISIGNVSGDREHIAFQFGLKFVTLPDKDQAWDDLHLLSKDETSDRVRYAAAHSIGYAFRYIPNKNQAWSDLIRLANDKDGTVRFGAVDALSSVFAQVPQDMKMQCWEDVFQLAAHESPLLQKYIPCGDLVKILERSYKLIPNKIHAWKNLIQLAYNNDLIIQKAAVEAIGSNFSHVPDRNEAWNDLKELCQNKNSDTKHSAIKILSSILIQDNEKSKAKKCLDILIADEDISVRIAAANALNSIFNQIPNKSEYNETNELNRIKSDNVDKYQKISDVDLLIKDENASARIQAARTLSNFFDHPPYKEMAWSYLDKLLHDRDSSVRQAATETLGLILDYSPAMERLNQLLNDEDSFVRQTAIKVLRSNFSQVSDKTQAWNNLCHLVRNEDIFVQNEAAKALISSFGQIPDKAVAWRDLIQLANDDEIAISKSAICTLGSVFDQVPDKDRAWNDLIQIAECGKITGICIARYEIGHAIGTAFSLVSNKKRSWGDVHRLVQNKEGSVRWCATLALKYAYRDSPYKIQAWNDMIKLAQDDDRIVRLTAASILDSAFTYVSDKNQAWNDLRKLTNNEECEVRSHAYYTMGKISIIKATEAKTKNNLKKELEAAIEYFEKSSTESSIYDPSEFCRPFYRSYFAIVFGGEYDAHVQEYIVEAKNAVLGSNSKDGLIKIIEYLDGAIQESKRLRKGSLEEIKWNLDQVIRYVALLEEKTPAAAKIIKLGMPIIDDQIKATITEIQEEIKEICKFVYKTGTPYESIVLEINDDVELLSRIDPINYERLISRIASHLKDIIKILPIGRALQAEYVIDQLDFIKEDSYKLLMVDLALEDIHLAIKGNICAENDFNMLQEGIRRIEQGIEKNNKSLLQIHRSNEELIKHIRENEKENVYSNTQIKYMQEALNDFIKELKDNSAIDHNHALKNSIEQADKIVKNADLTISQKVKFIFPLLPFLQSETAVELKLNIDAKTGWNKLIDKLSSISCAGHHGMM